MRLIGYQVWWVLVARISIREQKKQQISPLYCLVSVCGASPRRTTMSFAYRDRYVKKACFLGCCFLGETACGGTEKHFEIPVSDVR